MMKNIFSVFFSVFFFFFTCSVVSAYERQIRWNKNPEPDIWGYEIWYGADDEGAGNGVYFEKIDVINPIDVDGVISKTMDLPTGHLWHLAVVAVDLAGQKSEFSDEVLFDFRDSDGDGILNAVEEDDGSDPSDASSFASYYENIEAEDTTVDDNLEVVNNADTSGGAYVASPNGETGGLDIDFVVKRLATQYIWARVKAGSGGEDTYWYNLNNTSYIRWDAPVDTGWKWHLIASFEATNYENHLRLNLAEDNMAIDAIFVTDDLNFTPQDEIHLELEGENTAIRDGAVLVYNLDSASGGAYVGTPADVSGGGVEFRFYTKETVSANIWALVRAESGGEDTYWYKLDDASYIRWDAPIAYGWEWKLLAECNLEAGSHSLRVNFAEKNMALDKILVTQNLDYVPSTAEVGVHLVLEAEDSNFNDPAQSLPDESASEGAYAGTPDGVSGGGIELHFNSDAEAICYVWRRARALDGGSDTTWVNVNGNGWERKDIPISADWQWELLGSYPIQSGDNLIQMNFSESGMAVDSFVVTSDPDFVP